MSRILCHVDLGEASSVVKVGRAAGDEQLGFRGGLAAFFGGELGEAKGGIAAACVGGDSFCGGDGGSWGFRGWG